MNSLGPLSIEPLTVARTDLSSRPLIRCFRESPDVFVFCPRSFLTHVVVSVATFPIVLWLCHRFQADWRTTIGLSMFPVFGAGGFVIGELIQRFATLRARFDRSQRLATINDETIPFAQIQAVQVLEYVHEFVDDEKIAQQVNLVRAIDGKISRMNLLQGTQSELTEMARELADFLNVDFDDQRVGREAFAAISRRERVGMVFVLIVGVVFLIAAAYFATINLLPQQSVDWNQLVLVLGGLGICFMTFAISVLRRTKRDILGRPSNSNVATPTSRTNDANQ